LKVAVNAHQWIDNADRWNRIKSVISEDDVRKAYQRANWYVALIHVTYPENRETLSYVVYNRPGLEMRETKFL
jgi:hypothetical protein